MTTTRTSTHGDPRCYANGCRQPECRHAYRTSRKLADHQRRQGLPGGHIDSRIVANHMRLLIDSGWTIRQAARASGVSDRTLRYVLAGQTTIQTRNARKILALKPLAEYPFVSPIGPRRRIQAMAAIGWTINYTAREAGFSASYAFRILNGSATAVPRDMADRLAAVYRCHAGQVGPAESARTIAKRNNWQGPLAWGDNIDDPNAQPETEEPETKLTFIELGKYRRQEIDHLDQFGIPYTEIADRLGMGDNPNYVRDIVRELRKERLSRPAARFGEAA